MKISMQSSERRASQGSFRVPENVTAHCNQKEQ